MKNLTRHTGTLRILRSLRSSALRSWSLRSWSQLAGSGPCLTLTDQENVAHKPTS